MDNNLVELSEAELADMIANAQRALKEKQYSKRKEVLAQIRDLAASIGVSVEIIESEKSAPTRRGRKVAAKYRNPNNHAETWTGRGMKPRWLQALVTQGRNVDEFRI